ncbi:hypothetical protein B0H12DRAFT_1256098 [Mycena haematopus]|nr:hypothetical protein B0H12DRAFT_1256098 [Mycena haematopus]
MSLSFPQRTAVLIVGAGPCGMAAALSLNHQGIRDIVIVDALLAGENTSRAMVIQAATLEALNNIGSVGNKVETVGLQDGSYRLLAAVAVHQTNTEAGMLERLNQLGIKVWRPYKVVSVKPSQNAEEQMFEARFESGDIIETKYVIGTDGAHSVETAFNLLNNGRFAMEPGLRSRTDGDEKHDHVNFSYLVLGDVSFTSPPQVPTTTMGITRGNFTLFSQFPSKASPDQTRTVYHFVSSAPVEDGTAPQTPSAEYLQSLMDRCGPPALSSDPAVNPHPTRIDKLYWSSRYRTRSAIAGRYFAPNPNGEGAILLLGDAAHIHSPVGGQGMSLGSRDAISLGPVLKAHIDSTESTASNELFEDWGASRYQRASSVIAMTKKALWTMTALAGCGPRSRGLDTLYCGFSAGSRL